MDSLAKRSEGKDRKAPIRFSYDIALPSELALSDVKGIASSIKPLLGPGRSVVFDRVVEEKISQEELKDAHENDDAHDEIVVAGEREP